MIDPRFPKTIITKGSSIYRHGGPTLFTPNARIEIDVVGNLRNYEISGDGMENDFIRVLAHTQSYLLYQNQVIDITKSAEIEFVYCLNFCRIEYKLASIPLTISKIIFPGQKESSNAFGIYWIIENTSDKNQSCEGVLFNNFKFTLGDPYYIYTEWRRDLEIKNRLQTKYCGNVQAQTLPTDAFTTTRIWARKDNLQRQIFRLKKPFPNRIISTKPSEESYIILQHEFTLPPNAKGKIIESVAGGKGTYKPRLHAKRIIKLREKQKLSKYLRTLYSDAQSYFPSNQNLDRWLEIYSAVAGKTIIPFQMNKTPFLIPGHQYPRFYARDSHWQIRGLLVLRKYHIIKKALTTYFHHQLTNGAFPTSINLDGSPNQFSPEDADLDSTMFPILSLMEYLKKTHEWDWERKFYPHVLKSMTYLEQRDIDHDGWLEQGENQDWADTMYREGKVTYIQALYYELLKNVSIFAKKVGNLDDHYKFHQKAEFIKEHFEDVFWDPNLEIYVDHIKSDGSSVNNVNQDVCLAIIFGLTQPNRALKFLEKLKQECWTEWGAAKQKPYTNYKKYGPAGFYHNGGVWLWTVCFEALARFKMNQKEQALHILKQCYKYDFGHNPYHYHYMMPTEWFSSITGLNQYVDYKPAKSFTTGAGALLWVLSEGDIVKY